MYLIRPMQGILDSGIKENFCLGIRNAKTFACGIGILGFGNRNTAQGIRNPTNIWNPEPSKVPLTKNSKSSSWNAESMAWNPESKTVFDFLIWVESDAYDDMTIQFRHQCGVTSLRYRNRAEITCEQKAYPLTWFFCHRKNCPVLIV